MWGLWLYNTLVSYCCRVVYCLHNRSSSRVLYTLLRNTIDLCTSQKLHLHLCFSILYVQIPVEETRNVPLPPHHGHYLFIVTPSLPSSSSSSAHGHQLLRVYMKPLFSTEGVSHLLCSPGQRLLIKDLEGKKDNGQYVYIDKLLVRIF